MQKGFKVIDHTADIGIVAYGINIRKLFINAATGLFSLMVDLSTVQEEMQREVEVSAKDEEALLVEWLNELIYVFDVEHVVFKRFQIDLFHGNQVKAICFGEKLKSGHHKLQREVKAATYHMLKISKRNRGYEATIIFDI